MLYAIPTAEIAQNENYFLGLPAYFMAWIVFIILAAGIWRHLTIPRATRSVIAAGTILAVLLVFSLAVSHAQKNIPVDYDYNLRTVQRIARDGRQFLSNNDRFLTYWTSELPGVLQYFMMDPRGKYPEEAMSNNALPLMKNRDSASAQNFLSRSLQPAKAILMFQNDISTVDHTIYVPRGGEVVLRLMQAYVVDPASGLCAYQHYEFRRLRGYDTNGGLSAVLYVRCGALRTPTSSRSAGDFHSRND
jgi:hypothetical protein